MVNFGVMKDTESMLSFSLNSFYYPFCDKQGVSNNYFFDILVVKGGRGVGVTLSE